MSEQPSMITRDRDTAFAMFVAARRGHLHRVAYLLTGSWADAEDLVQTALLKLYGAWRRVSHHQPEAYARKIMLNAYLDQRRRGWWRREVSTAVLPERPAHASSVEDVDAVRHAMATLAPRQRATIVLRYWLDLSVDETAMELGCSPGTVKSQTARALELLRQALGESDVDEARSHRVTTSG